MNEDQNFNLKKRNIVFFIILGLLTSGLLLRYAFLMLKPGQNYEFSDRTYKIDAVRGNIFDRNGRILAMATRLGNIALWKPDMVNVSGLCEDLSLILAVPAQEIENRIMNSQSDFIYLKRQVEDLALKRIEDSLAEGRLQGINIEPAYGRIYPERNLASQIIGFIGDEGFGLGGIEYAFENDLAPVSGVNQADSSRRRTGNQIFLTIDINVQYILENIAGEVLRDTGAEAVMVAAMDPRTGDILGSASLPGFDPNNFRVSDDISRMNRPAIWAYEPGSVFKVFSLAALMDSGVLKENTFFECNGQYERITNRGERIVISCLGSHGKVSPREIITYSCNAGAAYAADLLESNDFYEQLVEFGFGSRTASGNPGESPGFLRTTDRWSERSKPTISIGQEIAVSALQMLQAASAIANDGVMIPPRVVQKIESPDGRVSRDYIPGHPHRILSPETAQAMRDYMTDVTSSTGTGWRAYMGDISMAVKTGTAQLTDPRTGAYSDTDFIASSLALLPAQSPSLVLYLVIVKPRGEIWGGRIAAPAIRNAAEALINYLGIPRGRNPQIIHSGEIKLLPVSYPAMTGSVPDFSGLAKRQLVPFSELDDIRLKISGDGWVVRQNPEPGSPLKKDMLISLELE